MEVNNVMKNSNGENGAIGNGNNAANSTSVTDDNASNTQKTFKQEDVNKIVTDRLARERTKWEKDYEVKVSEAEKLAKMSAEERFQHELKKKEEILSKREMEVSKRELKSKAFDTLKEKGIPSGLLDILDYSNAETCNASIEVLDKVFKSAVSKAIDERLKSSSTTPKTGTTNISGSNDPFIKGLRKK